MRKVVILDTSILCVWLGVPGKETCGTDQDRWDKVRVERLIQQEEQAGSTLVLPLATLIETGNHIAQAGGNRYKMAQALGNLIRLAADQQTPWAAFTDQSVLWEPAGLKQLADEWPALASQGLSIGDITIKTVAEFYAKLGFPVEILTGDQGLKAYEPVLPLTVPRRRRN